MPTATHRYLRRSPYKMRQVLGLIRGLEVDNARETLRFCERAGAEDALKVLDSAIANAEHNNHLPTDELYVKSAWADEGPILHRFRARARGRSTGIKKRTSHITIEVDRYSDDQLEARIRREEASASGTAARRPSRRRRVRESLAHDDHDHDHDDTDSSVEDSVASPDDSVASPDDSASVDSSESLHDGDED